MSEPFAERLSRFTPDAAGLDRDGLLFEAGRASVRPPWRWQGLAAVLAASQLVTLWLLWTRTPPAVAPVPQPPLRTPGDAPSTFEVSPGLWSLQRRLLQGPTEALPPVPQGELLAPDPPPLHAFARASSLLD